MAMYFARFVLFCADAINDFMYKNCPYVAGAIAFYTMFSLFPLFLAILSILGFLLGPEAEQALLVEQIAEVIPVSSDFIETTLRGIVSARTITGVTAIVGLIWASTAAFGAIRKGVNNAWGIRKTRPFLRERIMDVSLVAGAALLVILLLFITPVFGVLRELSSIVAPNSFFQNELLWDIATKIFSPIISFGIFILLYYFIPNTKVLLRNVWPSALAVALAFWVVNQGFVWYVQTYPVHNAVYGPVGAILALLTWVYISSIILLFGALLCSRYTGYMTKYGAMNGNGGNSLAFILTAGNRVRLRTVRDPSAAFAL
jgi:membrane protein